MIGLQHILRFTRKSQMAVVEFIIMKIAQLLYMCKEVTSLAKSKKTYPGDNMCL